MWHDQSRCPIGRSIAPADRVFGKGLHLERCHYCTLLDYRPALPTPAEPAGPAPN